MSQSAYEEIALKIVPTTHQHARDQQRQMIAAALTDEVNRALARQREKEFPELAQVRLDLETQKKRLEQAGREVSERERALQERDAALKQQEQSLAALLLAFDGYARWLDGDGEVDENGKRFNALREAYRQYKEKK